MLPNATPLRKSAPGPPNSSDEHVSCTAPATENAFLQILFKCHTPAIVFWNAWKPSRFASFCWLLTRCPIPGACHEKRPKVVPNPFGFSTFWLPHVLRAKTGCTFSTSELPKVVWDRQFFYILTWKCAQRHNGMHFFDIHLPKVVRTPQFFFLIWLPHVLRATTAYNFSSLVWPDASAPAALASLLFDLPEPQIIGKTQCFATFLPFRALASSFFWFLLSSTTLLFSLTLPISAFHLSIHIVGGFTSKFPSITFDNSMIIYSLPDRNVRFKFVCAAWFWSVLTWNKQRLIKQEVWIWFCQQSILLHWNEKHCFGVFGACWHHSINWKTWTLKARQQYKEFSRN